MRTNFFNIKYFFKFLVTNFIKRIELYFQEDYLTELGLWGSILEEIKEITQYLKSSPDWTDIILASVHLVLVLVACRALNWIFSFLFFNVWLSLNLRGILVCMLSQVLNWKNIASHSQWFCLTENVRLPQQYLKS